MKRRWSCPARFVIAIILGNYIMYLVLLCDHLLRSLAQVGIYTDAVFLAGWRFCQMPIRLRFVRRRTRASFFFVIVSVSSSIYLSRSTFRSAFCHCTFRRGSGRFIASLEARVPRLIIHRGNSGSSCPLYLASFCSLTNNRVSHSYTLLLKINEIEFSI